MFEAQNPGVTINLISVNEDGTAAYAAKVAGGYLPAMEHSALTAQTTGINRDNCDNMEASYIAKKSAMLLHGPWPWDKALAGDPGARQLGLPATPPAPGQKLWMQWQSPPPINTGWGMRQGVQKLPHWEQIKTLFFWWHSPDVVRLRADAEGKAPAYKLDGAAEPQGGAQYQGVLKDIGSGLWPQVTIDAALPGQMLADPYRMGGSPGVWDVEGGNVAEIWAKVMTNQMSVRQALDRAQTNWEASYKGLPA